MCVCTCVQTWQGGKGTQTWSRGFHDHTMILGFPVLHTAWHHPPITHPLCLLWKEPAWAEPSCDLGPLCGAQFPSSEEGVVITGVTTETRRKGYGAEERLWKAAGSCRPASVLHLPACPCSRQPTHHGAPTPPLYSCPPQFPSSCCIFSSQPSC